jgi:hypothetical protein
MRGHFILIVVAVEVIHPQRGAEFANLALPKVKRG